MRTSCWGVALKAFQLKSSERFGAMLLRLLSIPNNRLINVVNDSHSWRMNDRISQKAITERDRISRKGERCAGILCGSFDVGGIQSRIGFLVSAMRCGFCLKVSRTLNSLGELSTAARSNCDVPDCRTPQPDRSSLLSDFQNASLILFV